MSTGYKWFGASITSSTPEFGYAGKNYFFADPDKMYHKLAPAGVSAGYFKGPFPVSISETDTVTGVASFGLVLDGWAKIGGGYKKL